MNDLKPAIDELTRIFEHLNKNLYNGSLPAPVITIQTNGRRKNVLGWCTSEQVWVSKSDGEFFYEINIVAEYLDRPGLEIAVTMNHEMVHLYCNENDIKDVSRQGYFHNKKFKEIAEYKYLQCEKIEGKGWAKTIATDAFISIVEEMDIDESSFYLVREGNKNKDQDGEKEKGTQKKKSFKYQCPKCKSSVRATKSILIACMECKTIMLDGEGKPGGNVNKNVNNDTNESVDNKGDEANKLVNKSSDLTTEATNCDNEFINDTCQDAENK